MFKIAEGFQKPVFFHSQPYQHKKDGSFYDIIEKDSEGRDFEFRQFKGKVVYGVNVASKCGYTASGYALIAKLLKLRDQGVEVALFPCNQFGGQEVSSRNIIQSVLNVNWYNHANHSLGYRVRLQTSVLGKEWVEQICS